MHNNAKQMVENRYGFISKDKCAGIFIFSCLSQLSGATTFLNYNVMRLLSNIFKLSEETGSSMPTSNSSSMHKQQIKKKDSPEQKSVVDSQNAAFHTINCKQYALPDQSNPPAIQDKARSI